MQMLQAIKNQTSPCDSNENVIISEAREGKVPQPDFGGGRIDQKMVTSTSQSMWWNSCSFLKHGRSGGRQCLVPGGGKKVENHSRSQTKL